MDIQQKDENSGRAAQAREGSGFEVYDLLLS